MLDARPTRAVLGNSHVPGAGYKGIHFPCAAEKTHSIKTSGHWAGTGGHWHSVFKQRYPCQAGGRWVPEGRAGCQHPRGCAQEGGSTRQLLAKAGQGGCPGQPGHEGECGSTPAFPRGLSLTEGPHLELTLIMFPSPPSSQATRNRGSHSSCSGWDKYGQRNTARDFLWQPWATDLFITLCLSSSPFCFVSLCLPGPPARPAERRCRAAGADLH